MMKVLMIVLIALANCTAVCGGGGGGVTSGNEENDTNDRYPNELVYLKGHTVVNHYHSPLPHTYIGEEDLPLAFSWDRVNGTNYLTRSLNQHIPQWCGSCWAHAALSSLADRIKIARNAAADDINLSIQYILNCGSDVAGSCKGGSATGAYQFIHDTGFVPFDTCQPYFACSSDLDFGFCKYYNTSCTRINTCKTCTMKIVPSLHPFGEICREIDRFPNATVAEYGQIRLEEEGSPEIVMQKIKAEVFARGPVVAAINGVVLHNYRGGIIANSTASRNTTHAVSIVGWGVDNDDANNTPYYVVRNSWGTYWGEMGYFRIAAGANVLGIEESISWATPGQFTKSNFPCSEDGTNCGPVTQHYIDPSLNAEAVQRRLRLYKDA